MAILPIIPFILMLTRLIELVPEEPNITDDGYKAASLTKGKPTEATIGPMYAELVDGSINNKVKVHFLIFIDKTVEKYYYQVEPSNETITVTKVCFIMALVITHCFM